MGVEVALFHDLAEVERHAEGGLGRTLQPRLFDRIDWYRLVAEDLPQARPLVVSARNGVGRCWLFLAAGDGGTASSFTNGYGLSFGPVTQTFSGAQAPLGSLVGGLRRAGISHLYFERVTEDDPLPAVLMRSGWSVRRSKIGVSWRIHTEGMTFEDYWATRPSRLRNTAARRARKANLEIQIFDRFDERAMQDYEAVYAASWKPEEKAALLIRRLAMQEGEAGTLRLGLAYHEGRAVAGQLWLVERGIATIHKLAYREDARELSAGTVLSVEMFRRALDVDKVAMIDFGFGDHPYKAEWMTHSVPLYAVTAYDLLQPAGIAGLLRSLGSKLAARLRRWPQ